MGSNFEDIEESRELSQRALPIREVKRKTLKEIILTVMPDPSVTLDESLRFRIHRAVREQGKETTNGSIIVAVSALRKEAGSNNTSPGIKTTAEAPPGGANAFERSAVPTKSVAKPK